MQKYETAMIMQKGVSKFKRGQIWLSFSFYRFQKKQIQGDTENWHPLFMLIFNCQLKQKNVLIGRYVNVLWFKQYVSESICYDWFALIIKYFTSVK